LTKKDAIARIIGAMEQTREDRISVRLSPEDVELLDKLVQRFCANRSIVIRWALRNFAKKCSDSEIQEVFAQVPGGDDNISNELTSAFLQAIERVNKRSKMEEA
jgi:metal-responsive CopG/Arc/MetJ family transcriptional regulator